MKNIFTFVMMAIAFSTVSQLATAQPFPYNLMDGGRYDNKPGPSDGVIQLLDSVYHYTYGTGTGWKLSSKDDDIIYENNLLVNQTSFTHSNGNWLPYRIMIIKRNFAEGTDSTFYKKLSDGIWINDFLTVEKYNSLHLLTFSSFNIWDGYWKEYSQEKFTYDSVGNKLSRTVKSFETESNSTVNSFQQIFTYYPNYLLHTTLASRWLNNEWDPEYRATYYYNSVEKYDSVLVEYLMGINSNMQRFTMTYKPDSALVTTLWQDLQPTGQWLNYEISKAYFTDKGRFSNSLYQTWDNDKWVSVSRDIWKYDEFGNVNFEMAEQPVDDTWVPYYVALNTYDQDRFLLGSSFTYYEQGILMGADSTSYYFQKALGFEEVAEDNLMIYPNPATDYFAINPEFAAKQVKIYDSHGRPVKFINSPGKQVDVTGLASGMYLVRIIGEEESRMVKMVHK